MIKKLKNFLCRLFNIKACQCDDEPVVLEESPVEEEEKEESIVKHCLIHLRFRKNCPDCLRVVGAI